jgi:hypothetical protein
VNALVELKRLLKDLLSKPIRPGLMYVLTLEETMADKFTDRVILPLVEDDDTESRELTVLVNGAVHAVVPVAKTDMETKIFDIPQGAAVRLELRDIDDGTPPNKSDPSVREFEQADTIKPAQPGEMSVEVVEET